MDVSMHLYDYEAEVELSHFDGFDLLKVAEKEFGDEAKFFLHPRIAAKLQREIAKSQWADQTIPMLAWEIALAKFKAGRS